MTRSQKPRILFFGNEKTATGNWQPEAPAFRMLLEDDRFELAGLVAVPSRKPEATTTTTLAENHGIPVFRPDQLTEFAGTVTDLQVDVGVLVAYGRIIPQALIDAFPRGIVNLHPSLLPKYRGPTPVESVILNGDKKTGISLMALSAAMDAGPVYARTELSLDGAETKEQLARELSRMGADLLHQNLPGIIAGQLHPEPQDENRATYCKLIQKQDGILDFTKSAERIEREVRAYLGWPGSRTQLAGRDIILTKVRTTTHSGAAGELFTTETKEPGVYCGTGAIVIEKLKPAGKREMSGPEFLRGSSI